MFNLEKIKQKQNIHVVGASSAEGSAILDFLLNQGIANITAHDFKEEKDFKESFDSFHDFLTDQEKSEHFKKLTESEIKFNFKDKYLAGVEKADLIFVTQAWFRYEPNFPKLKEAKDKGVEFSSITKLYFSLFPGKIIGITGSSGKTTTSNLINAVSEQNGNKVYFTGNDRLNKQVLNEITEAKPDDLLVIEVSNRQLMLDLEKSPDISVITNLSPNHLDDHYSFENYIKVKKSLLKYQSKNDFVILNYDNQETRKIGEDDGLKSEVVFFSREATLDNGVFLDGGIIKLKSKDKDNNICSISDLQIKGPHNLENAMAAIAVGGVLGIKSDKIGEALRNFSGIKSRLELVREVKGVKFYEDSAACNPDGPCYAAQSFKEPLILIAGGYRENPLESEFDEMAKAVLENNVKAVILIGEMKDFIAEAINKQSKKSGRSIPIHKIDDFKKAVLKSREISEEGDVVVMSPGCESFGMFKDYRDRAEQFKQLVKKL